MTGVLIENSKLHASWSLNNSTFEDYYYKPEDQHIRDATIVDTVFGNATKKITTSETTAIVVGTTHNRFFPNREKYEIISYRKIFCAVSAIVTLLKKVGANCWCAELYSLILIKYSVRFSEHYAHEEI